jgi:[CysO sulfur-carrier protein]-S-L-cysteine hydrolase
VIIIQPGLLSDIETAAADAYPTESCGLLIGCGNAHDRLMITRIQVSANQAENNKQTSFEIDPQLRFDLMRELSGGSERIVGHFHSHPNGPAEPSARDLEQMYEPELVWFITSVKKGRPEVTAAFGFNESAQQFAPLHIEQTE